MTRVLFVCLGNICRSPMAHGIFRAKVLQSGLNIQVDSAGTSAFHNGEPPDYRAISTLKAKGISILDLRSRLFIPKDFDTYDYIFTMDESNQRDVLLMSEKLKHSNKPKMVMDLAYPNKNISVPDPYYGGATGFEEVYQMLDFTLEILMNQLRDSNISRKHIL